MGVRILGAGVSFRFKTCILNVHLFAFEGRYVWKSERAKHGSLGVGWPDLASQQVCPKHVGMWWPSEQRLSNQGASSAL